MGAPCNRVPEIRVLSTSAARPSTALPASTSGTSNGGLYRSRLRPKVTKAIDVRALGVTPYCLLFGRTPFDAETTFQLYQVIPREQYVLPERMGADGLLTNDEGEGKEVVHLLSRLMEKDPEKRITLAEVKVSHPACCIFAIVGCVLCFLCWCLG